MHPTRAASLLALIGAVLLLAALGLRGFSLAQALAGGRTLPVERPPAGLAVVGGYVPVEDGTMLAFQQSRPGGSVETSWYVMPAAGGMIAPYEPPESNLAPFFLHGGRAYVLVNEGAGALGGSPEGERVAGAVLAPAGDKLALATVTTGGRSRLYVLHPTAQLDWLGEEDHYIDLDWSPDGERLAFVSPRDGVDQVFVADVSGETYRQLTFDPSRKISPRWSPDGRSIAYLAATGRGGRTVGLATSTVAPLLVFPTLTPPPGDSPPVPGRTDVYLMDADGAGQRALTDTPDREYALAWLVTGGGSELGYAVRQASNPAVSYYYALGAGGDWQTPRRVYPPALLEAIECPAHFPHDRPSEARITISNSGLAPVDLPLILRARGQPFTAEEVEAAAAAMARGSDGSAAAAADAAASAAADAAISETVTLLPGERRTLTWEVRPAPGRFTYLSVITNLRDPFPVYEQHCSAPNSYYGLPRLPFLPLTILLAGVGLAVCLPRLFQRKSLLWWALWLACAAALVVMTQIEIGLV